VIATPRVLVVKEMLGIVRMLNQRTEVAMARGSEKRVYESFRDFETLGFRVAICKYGRKYSVTLSRKNCFSDGFYDWLRFEGSAKQVKALAKAIWLAYYLGHDEASAYYRELLSEWSRRYDAADEQEEN
jgi:hypothetical protein